MSEIVNNQTNYGIPKQELESFVQCAIPLLPEGSRTSVSILITTDEAIAVLNREYRGIDSPTDVLSFPSEPEEFENTDHLGDLVISVERAALQALENGLSLEMELKQLVLHGLLHLCGLDHESDNGEMNSFELDLRDKLAINL
ncbi:MAG: rRNA maturation RNase YbeY [Pyrinomonadaceae bacterium]